MHASQNQTVSVQGDGSQVNVVGGDFVFAETIVQSQPDFFSPNLTEYKSSSYISPVMLPDLIKILNTQRVVVLGGASIIDKAGLARHLAWYLGEKLQTHNGNTAPPVKEWYRSSDMLNLTSVLGDMAETSIFILPDIEPQHINFDLLALQRGAGQRHYIIVSTETPYDKWKAPHTARSMWYDMPEEGVYHGDDLTNLLQQKLNRQREQLPPNVVETMQRTGASGMCLVGQIALSQVAARLKTPEHIAVFVQLLIAEQKNVAEGEVQRLIQMTCSQQDIVPQWYNHLLSPREQLLAIGLSFFSGLYEDQFFAALEEVVEAAWKHRDSSLRALDYCDLDDLLNFIRFVEEEHGQRLITLRSPEHRQAILKIAWNSHRRQILTALPSLAKLVQNSVNWRSLHTELYGSQVRRRQLRQIIAETISDIGRYSVSAIEDTLLALATDEDLGVQAVAARALARWREYDRDPQLFETLERWQTETRILSLISALLSGRNVQRTEGPRAYIRATVALTVGYAAQYDPPNGLSPRLATLFEDLSSDNNALVRHRFRNYTLPMMVVLHLQQLQARLRRMTRFRDLEQPIGVSLALAYRGQPNAVIDLLHSWRRECQQNKPHYVDPRAEPTLREALLATVALTYGEIHYEGGLLTADDAFREIREILHEERHPFVRTAAIVAITRLARLHFDVVSDEFQDLLTEIDQAEQDQIVQILAGIYLEQRQMLEGGDDEIIVDGKRYPVWLDTQRPLTNVEKQMYRWIANPRNASATRISYQAQQVFARGLEQEETRRIDQLREARALVDQQRVAQPDVFETIDDLNEKPPHSGFFKHTLVPWLATLDAPKYRPVIQTLLPDAITLDRSYHSTQDFVLRKWHETAPEVMDKIAVRLERALKLVRYEWAFQMLGCLVFMVLIIVVVALGFLSAALLGG